MTKKNDVAVQKGPIEPVQYTYKWAPYEEQVKERAEQVKMLKRGQTMELKTPKQ